MFSQRTDTAIDAQFDLFFSRIRFAVRILEHFGRACLKNVRVKFKADPISELGTFLSGPEAAWEACKLLEKALLTFPNSLILGYAGENCSDWRAGRAALCSPIIQRAFSMLNEQKRLRLDFQ